MYIEEVFSQIPCDASQDVLKRLAQSPAVNCSDHIHLLFYIHQAQIIDPKECIPLSERESGNSDG